MFKQFPQNKQLVPFDSSFRISEAPALSNHPDDDECKQQLTAVTEEISRLQRIFHADKHYALLLIFQALDAGGKDSTIRKVFLDIDPAGFRVVSFKAPTTRERGHDFLWRTSQHLPKRGKIAIFNRSYYEEVLTVKVHPEFLSGQNLPETTDTKNLWQHRYESIRAHELHLARNGTVILKFWLNVSEQEQCKRLLARLDKPHKNWKFDINDITERQFRPEHQRTYETCLNETSRPWAPWYAIPADNKPYMRLAVAGIIRDTLAKLPLRYPNIDSAVLNKLRAELKDH